MRARTTPFTSPSTPSTGLPRGLRAGAGSLATGALALALTAGLVPGTAHAADPVLGDGQVAVTVDVPQQRNVQVAADARTWPADVLESTGVPVDGNDLVKVVRDGKFVKGKGKRVRHGDRVKLIDVRKRTQVKKVRTKPRTVTVPTTKLKPGKRKVVRQGKPGVQRVKARRTTHNGRLVDYTVVQRKTVRKATPKRVLVGRKAASVPGTDGLNWAALARCESGGNPRAVNAAGYYGLYQFNVGTWNSVGGSGMPHHASPAEQTHRAKLLYKSRGAQPWPHCGRYL
ncbi:resuscitation-promoting factor [Nocardioides solisilvae]|uniref:resuscitation-promoting factor n=1 Tax=Nocardioides solisilvae TaxID=1542435 RepID=UPI001EF53472|nr:resuscitation-promoting factor [Nocardioides solisilvae]